MKIYYFKYENGNKTTTYISGDKKKIEEQHRYLGVDAKYEEVKNVGEIIEIEAEKLHTI
ncbi:hypothetical protein [Fusobacterium ulcerans]|uniref:hypothetical protein n=1 Tax=Fusobacterium ulcerans TaxID=861 RepID=UPI001558E4BD|nr:hypothetical protein [Fusobacterium ulcerans]